MPVAFAGWAANYLAAADHEQSQSQCILGPHALRKHRTKALHTDLARRIDPRSPETTATPNLICSEVLLTHLFFPGCVRLVGDLAHFWCSSSDPPYLGPTWGNIDKVRQKMTKKGNIMSKNTLG